MTRETDWSPVPASGCQGRFSILINAPSYKSIDPSHLSTAQPQSGRFERFPAPSAVTFNAGVARFGRSQALTARSVSLTIWLLSAFFGTIYRLIGLVVTHPGAEEG